MIGVVITSYNRPDLLRRTVYAWRANVTIPHVIIIADDGSDDNTREVIYSLSPDIAIIAGNRRGLGENLNAGLRSVPSECEYVFILQDDFEARYNLDSYLERAIGALENGDADTVRFGSPMDSIRWYPNVYRGQTRQTKMSQFLTSESDGLVIVTAKSEDAWVYTDNPHLRRAEFVSQYGWYETGKKMADTEIAYRDKCNRFGIVAAWFAEFETNPPFDHIGAALSNREHRGL